MMKQHSAMLVAGLFVLFAKPISLSAYQKPDHPAAASVDRRRQGAPPPLAIDPQRAAAAARLQSRVPKLRIDYDETVGAPKFIASPEVFLSGPQGQGRALSVIYANGVAPGDPYRAVKLFLNEYALLYGHGAEVLATARLKRDYVTPHNGLRSVLWEQQLDGIAVYESTLIGHLSRDGELVNLSSTFLPELARAADAGTPNRAALQAEAFVAAEEACAIAAQTLGEELWPEDVIPLTEKPARTERRQTFLPGALPGEAKVNLVWLPLNRTSLRLCWQVELTRRLGGERFRVLVDAETGEVLLSRCLTIYLSDATYRVYTRESPSPLAPTYAFPTTNQPPLVPRTLVTLSALDTNASPLGWISDADNETRGNNVDAHLDRHGDDFPDLPRPHGTPFRVFDFPLDLNQVPSAYGPAAAVQLFYWCNWMHDKLYGLGFTEAAGNYQKDNFGRGGFDNDPVLADAQDGSGTDNANFTPTSDGESPRIQMYVFSGPTPNRDGDLDAEVVLHEYTHGLSERLVGGGIGISALQASGMGEGWSDYYALSLLSQSGQDPEACYAMGAYATYQFSALTQNYYFGIRRYPYSTDRTKNPLTFKDIDAAQADPHYGIPVNPVFGGGIAYEVHNQGEVWCVTLWEMRANLIRKHGFDTGNQLALQLVTDGMKLSPPNPNFLEARDAILQADQVNTGGANFNELWAAFAKRGMGFSATAPPSATTFGVVEAYDLPDALLISSTSNLIGTGPVAGPFAPGCETYVLTNHTAAPVQWSAHAAQPWLTVSPFAGTLPPGTTTSVLVCVTAAAKALPFGVFSSDILFSNLTSGFVQTRVALVRVLAFTGLPFTEGFESGGFAPYWSLSGTGPYRTMITSSFNPHGGTYQLVMDSSAAGVFARNELTLGLDLSGYTNVVLRFWAKSFSDEPDGPPSSPFYGGANFDGVAISEDGYLWYEAQGLRTLTGSNTEIVVDLDAGLAAHGLSYKSTFQIRFNHYDNNPVPTDGIALDDISITGIAARRFTVAVPAQAKEGSGVLANAGRLRLGAPVAAAVTVHLASSDLTKVRVPAAVTIPAGSATAAFDLTILDDRLLEGTQPVSVSASAPGYVGASATMLINDNETGVLKVEIPGHAQEGDGVLKHPGRVKVKPRPARDIVVQLSSSDPTEALVPPTVIIPAGHEAADFQIAVVDDKQLDGPQWVVITAHVDNWSDGQDSLRIRDNDKAQLFVLLPAYVSQGNGVLSNAGSVRLSGSLPTNLVVALASSDPGKLIVPPSVTVTAGQFAASFDLTVVDNPILAGLRLVTVTATAPRFEKGAASLGIFDNKIPLPPYQPDPPDGAANTAVVGVKLSWYPGVGEIVVNGGFEIGDFTGWTLVNGGYGSFVINDGTFSPPGFDGPLLPYAGQYSALSQQIGNGNHEIYQDVLIPLAARSATLSWVDRIHNHAYDYVPFIQEFCVEIRDTNDTVLAALYRTKPGDPLQSGWVQRSFDISRYCGQTIRVAFREIDTLSFLNVYLDDISVWIGETGATTYDVYFGTNPKLGPESFLGNTTNAFWALPRLALDTTYYWRVVSKRGAAQTVGPVWRLSTRGVGPVAFLRWSSIPSPESTSAPFGATITAFDDLGNVAANFAGPVTLRGLPGTGTPSAIVVSEMEQGQHARAEFANVSGRPVNLSGWQISIYDGKTWPGPRLTFTVPTNTLAQPGDVFALYRSGNWSSGYPNFIAGANFYWLYGAISNSMAVLLRDAAGNVVDFVCAVDANPALITNPLALPAAEWRGHSLPLNTNTALTYQRIGNMDHNDASDWIVATSTPGALTSGMADYFQSRIPVTVLPSRLTDFVNGVWTGQLALPEPADLVILEARDLSGHTALSNPFRVTAADDLALTLADQPNLLLVTEDVTYTLTVTNSGPAAATGVRLTDTLPAGVALISVTASPGRCTNAGGVIACDLGVLPGGTQASVTIVARTSAAGLITNTASVTRHEPEGYVGNNTATVVSTVDWPSLAITDVTLVERDTINTNAVFTVLLTAPSRLPVSVNFATLNATAEAGSDYLPVSGTLQFSPGVVAQRIVVPVRGDLVSEQIETFSVVLTSPTNAVLLKDIGVAKIIDNDPPPWLAINNVSVIEGPPGTTTNAVFTVTLSAPSELAISVSYGSRDGTRQNPPPRFDLPPELAGENSGPPRPATAWVDYQPVYGLLTFPPGVTHQTITVAVNGDNIYEGLELFSVELSNAVHAELKNSEGVGAIVDDDGGQMARFDVSAIPSPRYAGFPFPVTVAAKDGLGRVFSNFNGVVSLYALPPGQEVTIGSGTNVWEYPFGTGFHDERLQVIYPASEIGTAGSISALALNVATPPVQALNRWTIRLQHTSKTSDSPAAFEGDGWTTVYQHNQTVSDSGWLTFIFDTPFAYNGTNSLLVDFSFNNASYSSDGWCGVFPTAAPRSVYFRTDSAFGDPLNWAGTNPPPPQVANRAPMIRFTLGNSVAVTPVVSGQFANGVWRGDLTVLSPQTNLALRVTDAEDHVGLSNGFAVEPGTDADGDGLADAWELKYFGSLTAPGGGPNEDPDHDGLSNLLEFRWGSNPLAPPLPVVITSVRVHKPDVAIQFTTDPGSHYRVEHAESFAGPWTVVADNLAGFGSELVVIDIGAAVQPHCFYRVRLLP